MIGFSGVRGYLVEDARRILVARVGVRHHGSRHRGNEGSAASGTETTDGSPLEDRQEKRNSDNDSRIHVPLIVAAHHGLVVDRAYDT